MIVKPKKLLILVLSIAFFSVNAQTHHAEGGGHEQLHKFSLITANSLIRNSLSLDGNNTLIVPTFGFNYDYYFNAKWGAGIHSDILLQQFKVETHKTDNILVRDNPVALCGMLNYKPSHNFVLMGGFGYELEKHETLNIFRFGVGYEIPIQNNWEIGFDLEYDIKINAYGALMFGVVFSKIYPRLKNH